MFVGVIFQQMYNIADSVIAGKFAGEAALAAVGVAGSGWLMRLVNTPSDIFADGQLYLGIYVGGFVFLFLYNVATGIFNSLGDSRTPLYFLIGSSLSNIVLDWAFVALFHWGVAGVAWATFLALRVILAFAFSDLLNAAVGVWMAWPVGWCISTAMSLCFYLRGHWMPSWSRNAAEQEAEALTEEVCAVEEG